MAKNITTTPMMKQFEEMKRRHPDAVLLFRVGDFYETLGEDAVIASKILGITLLHRANGKVGEYIELAGFPHHALDIYLPKLVRAGKKVAICEQLEDPRLAKKPVQRGEDEPATETEPPAPSLTESVENTRKAAAKLVGKPVQLTIDFDF